MDQLVSECNKITFLNQKAQQLQVENDLYALTEQHAKLCGDLGKVAAYSANQYRQALPALQARSTIYRYEKLPLFSNNVNKKVRTAMEKAAANLKSIAVDPTVDRSSTTSLQQAVSSNIPSANIKDPSVSISKLQAAQQQMLAQRVDFWQSQIGIESLQSVEQKAVNDSCAYLFIRNTRVTGCPNPY